MILKTLTYDRGTYGCWNYYTGIQNASVFYNEDAKMMCVAISGKEFEGEVVIGLTGPAYLCDDRGQTIEKIGKFNNDYQGKKLKE